MKIRILKHLATQIDLLPCGLWEVYKLFLAPRCPGV